MGGARATLAFARLAATLDDSDSVRENWGI